MLHPAAPILLLLVASLLLLVCGAPPAPQPGSALKQTSRKEILERRAQHMNASQRRQSPGVCPAPNPVLTAAVYLNRYVGSSSIIYVTTANFDDCVARCAALTSTSALSATCTLQTPPRAFSGYRVASL